LRNLRKIKNTTSDQYFENKEQEIEFKEKENLIKLVEESKKLIKSGKDFSSLNVFGEQQYHTSRKLNIPKDHDLILNDEDSTKSLKELVENDLNPYLKEHEKALQIEQDLYRLSKVSDQNIIDLRPAKDYYLKKKALNLAKIWRMDVSETKHWYRRLKREEKQIIKALVQRKKFEQKKKLKKLEKQWKIENDDIIEVNYLEKEREKEEEFKNKDRKENSSTTVQKSEINLKEMDKEDVDIPEHYKNLSEFLFFGEDKEFLKHYKRTCKNILDFFVKFFSEDRQTIKKGIGRNYDIVISEVRMNRACTVVYVWYEVPKLDMQIAEQTSIDEIENLNIAIKNNETIKKDVNGLEDLLSKANNQKKDLMNIKKSAKLTDLENLYKKLELNINKAVPYLKAILTKKIGLKYAPDIRFSKDNFANEYSAFDENLEKMSVNISEKNNKKLIEFLMDEEEIKYLTTLYYLIYENKEHILDYFDQIQEGLIDKNTLFPLTFDNLKKINYEILLEFSELLYTDTYNPSKNLNKICKELGYNRDKIKKFLDYIKLNISFENEELENYYKFANEKKKTLTLDKVQGDKALKKYLKKNKITYEELQSMKGDVDKKEAINTYLANFDYQVPGIKSHVISFAEMAEQGKKAEKKGKAIDQELKNISRKEYKKFKELSNGGKTKSQKFWDDLEKYYK